MAIGAAICATAIYVGETADAPGAALIGFAMLIGAVVFSARMVRRKA